jgi:hypothetical protein
MPVTVIVETGAGLANSNSYLDPAGDFATDYAAAWIYGTAWNDATDDEKAQAVVSATRTLDAQFVFRGIPSIPETQALAWPRYIREMINGAYVSRTVIPTAVKKATMELALALLENNRTSDTGSGTSSTKEISLGNGALKIVKTDDPAAAPVKSIIPPSVRAILRDYGHAAGGSMTPVERR